MNKILMILVLILGSSVKIASEVNENKYHPVHVSYTNVEYNKEKKQFEILYKIFADDFDLVLNQNYNIFLDLENNKRKKGYEQIITKYIFANFQIIIDKKNYTESRLKFSYFELKEKAVWLHFTYKFKGSIENIEIRNSLMTDLYYDQTNLLIFNYLDHQEAIRFTNDKTKEILSLKTN